MMIDNVQKALAGLPPIVAKEKAEHTAILERLKVLPSWRTLQRELHQMGICAERLTSREFHQILIAIQLHHKLAQVNGTLDIETCATIFAMYDAWRRKKVRDAGK